MGVFCRKPNICKLAAQLEHIERQLLIVEKDTKHLPSPDDMKALAWIRFKLPTLTEYTDTLEKQLWQRIEAWQQTPYTPAQLFWRRLCMFLGWWIAGTIALWQSILGWFTALFPQSWHVLPASAVLALLILSAITIKSKAE